MKQQKIIIILVGILISIGVQAQNNLSLSEAIAIGLENNYELQIVRNTEKISALNNSWGNAGAMPNINFTVNGRENFNMNDNEDYRTQTLNPDLSLNWTVFNGFSARINKQRFEELELQSQGNTVVLVESTIQDIIMAYNNCLLQQEMVEVYKELADLSEDRYARTEDSKAIGVSTTYESLQAKTSWLEDQSNYLQQKVNYENAIRTLNFALAIQNDTKWELTSKLETTMPDYDLESLSEKLKSSNQTLKNQYLNQSLMAKETALAKSKYYPSLNLNTGVSNTGMDQYYSGNTPDINQDYSDAYVGLTLSFNIFNGGTRKRSVEIAKINEETTMVQTIQMEHSLNNQLLQMYSNYVVQKAILDLVNEQEAAAKLNLNLSADKLQNGSINSFNYRDVQIAYMNAAIAKFRATYNAIQSNTDLLRITGGIINEYE